MDPGLPGGFTGIRILVDLYADGPVKRLARLPELTERYCVVSLILKNPPQLALMFGAVQ